MKTLFRRVSVAALCAFFPLFAFAVDYGSIPTSRIPANGWVFENWTNPGSWTTIDVTANGLPANSSTTDASIKVVDILNANPGGNRELYFPAGTYYFKSDLNITRGNIQLVGDGPGATIFVIDAAASLNAEIRFSGANSGSAVAVSGSPAAGDQTITVASASTIAVGDFLQLYLEDGRREFSLPHYSESQIVQVTAKSGNSITLDMKLGSDFPAAKTPKVQEITMRSNIRVADLTIRRTVKPTDQAVSNLEFEKCYNVLVQNIEGDNSRRAHVSLRYSKKAHVVSSWFHDYFGPEAGGEGYGIYIMNSTGCRATDNRLWNLRHHIILEVGANHNIVSYNSVEGQDAYNELAFHATYARFNLIEGNSFVSSYADNSKNSFPDATDETGPLNMWFRNRATQNIGSINTATVNLSIIGNLASSLSTSGSGHYLGANRVAGTIQWGSLSSSSTIPTSLYRTVKPGFLGTGPWPVYGPGVDSTWGSSNALPAANRPLPGEIVVDNADAGFSAAGTWTASTALAGYFGANYLHDGSTAADATKTATWTSPITTTGTYSVYMRWTSAADRPDAAPVEVNYNGGVANLTVNQQIGGGTWVLIGTWSFTGGSGDYVKITGADAGYTIADAVRFVKQ
ncbi:MAG TPA: glycosyl hydrolase family 28-related protein [Opitutaceae bacterium]